MCIFYANALNLLHQLHLPVLHPLPRSPTRHQWTKMVSTWCLHLPLCLHLHCQMDRTTWNSQNSNNRSVKRRVSQKSSINPLPLQVLKSK